MLDDRLAAHGRCRRASRTAQEEVQAVTGRVPYPVGATVWTARDLVNHDRNSSCSVGLYEGTYSCAESFSELAARHDGAQITETVMDHIRTA